MPRGAASLRSHAMQTKFHGLWWMEKVFVLPGGRVLCGAPLESDIVDEKALKPYAVSESLFAPTDKVPDGMVFALRVVQTSFTLRVVQTTA